jgi:peptidyl-prolyl cis-trans isomerase SurA
MKGHRLVASAGIGLLVLGCKSPFLPWGTIPLTPHPEEVAARASGALATSGQQPRMQKPDGEASDSGIRRTVFEAVHEPFPDLKGGEIRVRVRAHVNGEPILDEEVQQLIYPDLIILPPQMSDAERTEKQAQIFRGGLQQIIDREVILQDAFARLSRNGVQYLDKLRAAAGKEFDKTLRQMKAKSNAKTDEEFKEILRAQGQSLEGIRRQWERNFMAREYMRSRIYPYIERWTGHQEILNYYQEHAGEFQQPDSVKWQDIFVDAGRFPSRQEARALADQLAARARAGEDFAELAKKYDNGNSVYNNGEGFGHQRAEIKPIEAEPILFGLKDGEVGPVIELPTGYHVIRLVKRDYAGLIPLDSKTQDAIRRKLQNIVAERESKRVLADLKQTATIEIETQAP